MKKFLLLLFFSVFLTPFADAQIMHFSSKVMYDQNGVQYSTADKYPGFVSNYFAMVNNNMIYQCDKNGNRSPYAGVWKYIGEKNGVYVFKEVKDAAFLPSYYPFLYLSKDWKKINLIYNSTLGSGNETIVYEKSDPNDIGAPSQFY